MKDDDLKKLSRVELLEILVEQSKKIDDLEAKLAEANDQLANREILIRKAGSIAEASLQLNHVFEAAEEASKQYVDNIKILYRKELSIYNRMKEIERAKQTDAGNQTKEED